MSLLFPDLPPRPKKFIPDGDSKFANMARLFANEIARDPAMYHLSPEDAAAITTVVTGFRDALGKALHKFSRTQRTILQKDEARAKAEAIVRKYGKVIRANPDLSAATKRRIGVSEPPTKLGKRKIPRHPPLLTFHGAGDGSNLINGTHILRFKAGPSTGTRGKPEGAARVELFVDLVPPGEPIPKHPAERTGRPWYLRSITKSPKAVQFPVPSQPMLVVYWARWADATGEVGPFSQTCIARQEGWTATPALPESESAQRIEQRIETKYIFIHTPIAGELPEHLAGDAQAQEVAAHLAALAQAGERQRVLEAAPAKRRLLNAG